MSADETHYWGPDDDRSDGLSIRVSDSFYGSKVGLWAGDELDPAYLSPAAARQLADELPALLREFADRAEAADARQHG